MLLLGSNALVLGRRGPVPAGRVQAGDELLALMAGRPTHVTVVKAAELQTDLTATWLCCEAGDVVVGGITRVVTSLGPLSGDDLLEDTDSTEIGRMAGSWPPLEVFHEPDGWREGMVVPWGQIGSQLAACATVKVHEGEGVRIGFIPTNARESAGRFLMGGATTLEVGPARWSWMRRIGPVMKGLAQSANQPSREELLGLWQSADLGETYSLPIEFTEIRHLVVACLKLIRSPYRLEYRPRYRPLEVVLVETTEWEHHSQPQVVVPVRNVPMVQIELAKPGCYLVANQLLIAT